MIHPGTLYLYRNTDPNDPEDLAVLIVVSSGTMHASYATISTRGAIEVESTSLQVLNEWEADLSAELIPIDPEETARGK
jgi:hypothetical protein